MPLSEEKRRELEQEAIAGGVNPAEVIAAAEKIDKERTAANDEASGQRGGPVVKPAETPQIFAYMLGLFSCDEVRGSRGYGKTPDGHLPALEYLALHGGAPPALAGENPTPPVDSPVSPPVPEGLRARYRTAQMRALADAKRWGLIALGFDPGQPRESDGKWTGGGAGGAGSRSAKGLEGIHARLDQDAPSAAGGASARGAIENGAKAIEADDIAPPTKALAAHEELQGQFEAGHAAVVESHRRLRDAQRDAVEKVRTLDESIAARRGGDDIGESLLSDDDLVAARDVDFEMHDAHDKMNEALTGDRREPKLQDLENVGGHGGVPFETAHAEAMAAVQKLEAEHAAAIGKVKGAEDSIGKAQKAAVQEGDKYSEAAGNGDPKIVKVKAVNEDEGPDFDSPERPAFDKEVDHYFGAKNAAEELGHQIAHDAEEHFGFDAEDAKHALREGSRSAKSLLKRIEKAGAPKKQRKAS